MNPFVDSWELELGENETVSTTKFPGFSFTPPPKHPRIVTVPSYDFLLRHSNEIGKNIFRWNSIFRPDFLTLRFFTPSIFHPSDFSPLRSTAIKIYLFFTLFRSFISFQVFLRIWDSDSQISIIT